MFQIDQNSLPFVRTRHALIAIDLQMDFVSPDGTIPVSSPPGFIDNITDLASKFRGSGNVIWVRTVFEASRPVNGDGNSESVITDAELPATRSGGDERPKLKETPSQKLTERFTKLAKSNGQPCKEEATAASYPDEEDKISETFLTIEPGQIPHAVSQSSTGANFPDSVARAIDGKKDLVFQKTFYSAFKDGSLVQTLRAKFVTEIYLCGALTNISVYATAIDAARHGYTITIIEDCLGYRNKARHDEALRKLVEFTGCNIVASTDLIRDMRERERAQMVPTSLPNRSPRPSERPRQKDSNLDNMMANLNLRPDESSALRSSAAPTGPPRILAVESRGSSESPASSEQLEEPMLPTRTPSTDLKRERVKTKIKTRRRHSKSGARDMVVGEPSGSSAIEKTSSMATSALWTESSRIPGEKTPITSSKGGVANVSESQDLDISPAPLGSKLSVLEAEMLRKPGKGNEKRQVVAGDLSPRKETEEMAIPSVISEQSGLCEGDTIIIHDLLDTEIAENIFEKVRDEVQWQKMSHQGGDVPRLVAVQGEIGNDGSIPIYRHPANESPPLLPFSSEVSAIRKRVEAKLGHSVNHVLIQFYRDGNDYISEHSDKTLDIVPKTFIANVSLGAQRTMVFRMKKAAKAAEEPQRGQNYPPRQATRAPLPHNSMCKMGLVTNMRWLHGIRQDKRMISEKSAEELAFNGGRISLTFRTIGTFLSKDQTRIWGQGATSKCKAHAEEVINGDNAESEKMIRAFGKENHVSDFDWKEQYGEGFNVLHIENTPKLFLSGDDIANLKVKLMLADYGVEWCEGKLSPPFHWKGGSSSKEAPPIPENLRIRFVDNDLGKSTVVGDLAVMLYLDAAYGTKTDISSNSRRDIAQTYTRFQQSGELLKIWRVQPFTVKPFRKELKLWDTYATEGQFIAGENISIADYAFWPLLEDISTEWDNFDGLDNLAAYHKRLKQLDTFIKVLGAEEEKQRKTKSEEQAEVEEETKLVPTEAEGKKDVKKDKTKPDVRDKKAS